MAEDSALVAAELSAEVATEVAALVAADVAALVAADVLSELDELLHALVTRATVSSDAAATRAPLRVPRNRR